MDIEGLGEKLAYRFLDEGLIPDQADIYDLTAEQLAALEGFGETSAEQPDRGDRGLQASSRSAIVLFALGLPGIGYVTAQALAEHFGTMDALIEADAEADRGGRGRRPDPRRADPGGARRGAARCELIERLRERGLRFELDEPSAAAQGGPLDGKTFVLTGTLPEPHPRGGDRADQARRRQGHRLGLEEDRLRGRRRQPRARSSPRPRSSGTEVLDEAGLRALLSSG